MSDAYQGVEDLASFPDPAALAVYREELLERSRPQAELLARLLPEDAGVLEIACGNGRLLLALAARGALGDGVGTEIADSRIAFARAWAAEAGAGLRFERADALRDPLPAGRFDAVICITGAFGYFEAGEPGAGARLAQRMAAGVRPGGLVCLELYPHPRERRLCAAAEGEVRLWRELPASDPWRFYLSRLVLDEDRRVLEHEKTFIHRTTGEIDEGRSEALRLYEPGEVRGLLEGAGLTEVEAREDWTEDPYAGGDVLVVTARRPR